MRKPLLTPELKQKLSALIRANHPVSRAVEVCGFQRQTFYHWLDRGKKEPGSIYHELRQEYETLLEAKRPREVIFK